MSERLNKFFQQYSSESTIKTYRYALKEYYKLFYGESSSLEESVNRYFTETRDYEDDVRTFFASINTRPPKTVNVMIAGVKVFLMENDIEFKQVFWKRLRGRIRGSRALTLDKVPSNIELRKLLMHMPIQGKALYLLLESSGMRIGETLQLKLDDIDLKREPAQVDIRGEYTKTGNPRVAFMSREAKEYIQEWLKVRQQYLVGSVARSVERPHYKNGFKGKSLLDDRLFPFESNTAYMIWRNSLKKSHNGERDKSTNRYRLHPHVLRKFYRTKMGSLIPIDVVEALMGHEGYLTEVYRRYSVEDLAKFYIQGEPALYVFTEAGEVSKLRQEVLDQNKQLQMLVNGLTAENMDLKQRMKGIEDTITKVIEKLYAFENTPT